ncbi:response regulator [Shewanella sp. WXL01]|uniref:Response regulator n=1 Tax=Shewanella maritima TaxID=2520507 RepID=A0A411PCT3_9GAMM|nr:MULTISPECIES: winged helix-turn-helix domain-containing protein [Shewanella]NKF50644.1 response regulator [Shewanella sp. WXL01]QBF81369.1 response regulator [Shewanella maritima]
MTDILIIQQSHKNHDGIERDLIALGYQPHIVNNALDALVRIETLALDVVLLDLSVEQMDSLWLLLSQRANVPVIALAHESNDDERLTAFESGADDYLPQPYNLRELQLKFKVLARRFKKDVAHSQPMALFFDDLSYTVRYNDKSSTLTQTEYRLLKYLYDQQGQVVTKAELQRNVLSKDYGKFDRNLDMHVSNTRKKLALGNLPRELINTVRGRGYSFTFVAA